MKGNQMFAGLVAGVAVGTAVGLLLAPKPGKESRHSVVAQAGEIRHKTGGYVDRIRAWKKSKGNNLVIAGSSNGHANGISFFSNPGVR